jgi:hypothetical protein
VARFAVGIALLFTGSSVIKTLHDIPLPMPG